jgi:hypothetical protein
MDALLTIRKFVFDVRGRYHAFFLEAPTDRAVLIALALGMESGKRKSCAAIDSYLPSEWKRIVYHGTGARSTGTSRQKVGRTRSQSDWSQSYRPPRLMRPIISG